MKMKKKPSVKLELSQTQIWLDLLDSMKLSSALSFTPSFKDKTKGTR